MVRAHTLQQKDVGKNNMLAFQDAFSIFNLEQAKATIKQSGNTDVKRVALDIVDVVKASDLDTKNNVAQVVEAWSISLNAVPWADKVQAYFSDKKDVISVYAVKYLHENQMIIVVDDMTSDNVLEYNMFAFQVRNKYPELYDFMVIDLKSYEMMRDEFEKISNVYVRG